MTGSYDDLRLKDEVRKDFLSKRKRLTSSERLLASQNVQRHLEHFVRLHKFTTVLGYLATPTEISIDGFLKSCALMNLRIGVPSVEDELTVFYEFDPLSQKIQLGSYNMREPVRVADQSSLKFDQHDKVLVCIPGVAFDSAGNRLGRGKGHYDRFLQKNPDVQKAGILFHCQHSKLIIPSEPHDIKMDYLAKPDEILKIR